MVNPLCAFLPGYLLHKKSSSAVHSYALLQPFTIQEAAPKDKPCKKKQLCRFQTIYPQKIHHHWNDGTYQKLRDHVWTSGLLEMAICGIADFFFLLSLSKWTLALVLKSSALPLPHVLVSSLRMASVFSYVLLSVVSPECCLKPGIPQGCSACSLLPQSLNTCSSSHTKGELDQPDDRSIYVKLEVITNLSSFLLCAVGRLCRTCAVLNTFKH